MDTSDSEHFESADEEFNSDTEDKNVKTKTISDTSETLKLKEMTISEESINVSNVKEVSTVNVVSNDNSCHDLKRKNVKPVVRNPTADKSDKRSKPGKLKLGVKLGTKITSTSCNAIKCDDVEDSKLKSNYDNKTSSSSKTNIDDNHKTCISALKDIKNEENLQKLDKREEIVLDEESNMWADDEWEPISSTDNKLTNKETNETNKTVQNNFSSGWGGWGNWDVTSLLSTATMGVTTITNHVSQGLTTVLESGIGVPDPEELARLNKMEGKSKESIEVDEEEEEKKEVDSKNNKSGVPDLTFGLGSFVSGVSQITKLVESTGNKVISSGLDTLETIGKKTMEVLQEGDPGLKKKRAFLKIDADKPVLSHILREAKEKAEQENRLAEEKHVSKKANYETLFDDHQGLAHLEALEMLSRQCDIKLKTLLESHSGADLIEMQETLSQIKELCELTDEDEDEKEELDESEIKEKIETAVTELNVSISYNKLMSTWKDISHWLENLDLNLYSAAQLHEESINILAQLTAVAVELFHKTGELLLIKEHRSTVDEADSLVQLTTTMTTLISDIAKKASNKLNEKATQSGSKDNVNQFITNVYFEATNSSSYIKNAFELLIPVLQVGAV
ncbi:hypothetical protein ILUMI_23831 [Ignelater luminosus]|uniref:Protein FAM114A2 n=1 Tax=Ignelater luminosus TaxID=2038154 RepID=A0A8K0CBR3_IGNLU|nr:hypothetical protein ILUMI_23831 [Ignelater luminosus]